MLTKCVRETGALLFLWHAGKLSELIVHVLNRSLSVSSPSTLPVRIDQKNHLFK